MQAELRNSEILKERILKGYSDQQEYSDKVVFQVFVDLGKKLFWILDQKEYSGSKGMFWIKRRTPPDLRSGGVLKNIPFCSKFF